jgi:hypothetical protein
VAANLTPLFLDTAYIYALVNARDEWHERAVHWQQRIVHEHRRLVTTQLILVEVADGLAAIRFRVQAAQVLAALWANRFVEIIPFSGQLLAATLELYRERPDKDWGLTDCASFVVMHERGLLEALTVDEHFRQAGFRTLLRED